MSRYIPDLQARRKSSQTGGARAQNPHIVEPPKPPGADAVVGRAGTAEKPKSRQLPQVPQGQLRTASAPLSKTGAGRDAKAGAANASPTKTRRVGSHVAPASQLQPSKPAAARGNGGQQPAADFLYVDQIAEELETSSGSFVVPDQLDVRKHSISSSSSSNQSRAARKFSLPAGCSQPVKKLSGQPIHRTSHGAATQGTRLSKTSTSRKTSVRKASTIRSVNLCEQLTVRVDIHLHGLSLVQSRSAIGRHRRADLSRCSVNVSASLGGRVDTSAPFFLEKEATTSRKPGKSLDENRFTATLQQAVSLPVTVGVAADNPEKYLSKDIRITVEYGQRDLLSAADGIRDLKWSPLASGTADVATHLRPDSSRFSQQMSVPLTVHQSQASTATGCILDCTVIGTILQRKTSSQIDTTEQFSFDEEVFEFVPGLVDDDDDSEDQNSSADETPDGTSRKSSSSSDGPSARRSGASVSAMRAVGAHKKSIAPKRTGRASATDSPSEIGNDPLRTTAAFAFEGTFNRLGLLHVSVCSTKYSGAPASGQGKDPALKDGDKLVFSAEINAGLTKQRSKPSEYSQGMPLSWDSKQPQFTFYTLKSRQIFLSLYSLLSGPAPAAVKGKDIVLHGLANIPLNSVTDLASTLPLAYAQPSPMTFLDHDKSMQKTIRLTPCGEATVYIAFTSLSERQPCCGYFKARTLSTCGLGLPDDVQRLTCALKVDGVFKGMSSEIEAADGTVAWPHDQLCEVSASDSVDLEIHVWGRSRALQKWAAYGVLPIATAVKRQAEAGMPSSQDYPGKAYRKAVKQEFWVPLEPQGFVQVEVWMSESMAFSANEADSPMDNDSSEPDRNQTEINAHVPSPSEAASDIQSPEKQAEEGKTTEGRKKSDPKWEDLLLVLKDRVELRKEVEFLHETLRSAKAQLAESEFLRAKLELENRQLHGKLTSAKIHTKHIAKKATHLELRQLMLTASQEAGEENGYQTA